MIEPASEPVFERVIPVFRMFDEGKARAFYCDFLGFEIVMEHRFEPGLPLYMAVRRAGFELHLTEHHGDATPGATAFVWTSGLRALHVELLGRRYPYARPGLVRMPWGEQMEVTDPSGNRIRFCQSLA